MLNFSKPYFSLSLLANPIKKGNFIQKGALVVNYCDELVEELPDVKKYFYLIERKGWYGINSEKSADIKLVDDPSTIKETKKLFPQAIVLEFSNADFVDTDIFKPLPVEKKYTAVQIAAWEKFKRHELFIEAAAILRNKNFLKLGHFWDYKPQKILLKAKIFFLAKIKNANIKFLHVPYFNRKKIFSASKMNEIINTAKMGILTSVGEGVNRFKMECLSANLPFLVPEDATPSVKRHINEKTGVIFKPTPEGLAKAILYVEEFYDSFSPREYILKNTGMENALPALKDALLKLSKRDGAPRSFEEIKFDGRNENYIWDKKKAIKNLKKIIESLDK